MKARHSRFDTRELVAAAREVFAVQSHADTGERTAVVERNSEPEQREATILNVHDDAASRHQVTRVLRGAGYQVLEATTGEEALRRALEARPDVVVLDVRLPDLSGDEVCARLRSLPETASLAVLHTSAAPDKRVRGLEGGADAYLTRPFESEELIATVRSLLRMRHAEQQLRHHAAQLAEANQRKDELLAMLAHELRTPLSALMTAAGILDRRAPTDARERKMLGIIQRQTQHMAQLVEDLLDVSRLTRGKVELHTARVDLRAVLEQVLTTQTPRLEEQGLRLTAPPPAPPLWMAADPQRLEQVFSNLLDNALKDTDSGGTLSVRLERAQDTGRDGVWVRVVDTGMETELAPEMLELLAQSNASQERPLGSLGIGLTLVRTLVELHGGRLSTRSEGLGHGSALAVWLPLLPEQPEPVNRPPDPNLSRC
ncbi:MAG TPA: response regulator [Myxococcaceae bacterium]|nr:response regulator [Myxococcaceae bacterium]